MHSENKTFFIALGLTLGLSRVGNFTDRVGPSFSIQDKFDRTINFRVLSGQIWVKIYFYNGMHSESKVFFYIVISMLGPSLSRCSGLRPGTFAPFLEGSGSIF